MSNDSKYILYNYFFLKLHNVRKLKENSDWVPFLCKNIYTLAWYFDNPTKLARVSARSLSQGQTIRIRPYRIFCRLLIHNDCPSEPLYFKFKICCPIVLSWAYMVNWNKSDEMVRVIFLNLSGTCIFLSMSVRD